MRLIARIFALLLIPFAAGAQTATTKPATTTTGTGAQATKVVFQVPKNGWGYFTLTPANIPPLAVNIPALTVVPPGSTTFSFVCTIPPDSEIIMNPDGSKTITGAKCTLTPMVTP